MIVAALLLAAAAATPAAVEGWAIAPAKDASGNIDAVRTIGAGKTIQYVAKAEAMRSVVITLPGCGSEKSVDAPAAPRERMKAVYETLFDALDGAVKKCALPTDEAHALMENFSAAYDAVEAMAIMRALPVSDKPVAASDWAFEDLAAENEERTLRTHRIVGQGSAQASVEYRVMAGTDRRMSLTFGVCTSDAKLVLPADPAARLNAAKLRFEQLIKDAGASCKIDQPTQIALATGFDKAFAAIEDWAAQNPVAGN